MQVIKLYHEYKSKTFAFHCNNEQSASLFMRSVNKSANSCKVYHFQCYFNRILFIKQKSPQNMDSLRMRISKVIPTSPDRKLKEINVKQFKQLKHNLRYKQPTQANENQTEICPIQIEDEELKEKIETIKQKYILKQLTQERDNQTRLKMLLRLQKFTDTPWKHTSSSPTNYKINKIFKSLDRNAKKKNKQVLKDQKTMKTRLKNQTKMESKLSRSLKKSTDKLTPSVRRYRDYSSFQQQLQNRSIARKISSMKPSEEVNLGKLSKSYEEHQIHVQLRENYLFTGNRKTYKRLLYA